MKEVIELQKAKSDSETELEEELFKEN